MKSKILLSLVISFLFVQKIESQCWKAISTGDNFSIAIRTDGSLWTWGENDQGQLGDGTFVNKDSPIRVGLDNDWIFITANGKNAAAIKKDGTLWAWGDNQYGAWGDYESSTSYGKDSNIPLRVGTENNWIYVTTSSAGTTAIKTDGTIWGCGLKYGSAAFDQNSIEYQKITPTLYTPLGKIGSESSWVSVYSWGLITFAIKKNGTLWAWGNNRYNDLGTTATNYAYKPIQIGVDTNWKSISNYANNTFAVKTNGTLWAWGENSNSELGDGTNIKRITPIQIGTDTDWKTVSTGSSYTLAIKNNGTLWGWGTLIVGLTINKTPTKVENLTTWETVVVGSGIDFSFKALRNDATLWNSSGIFYNPVKINCDCPTLAPKGNSTQIFCNSAKISDLVVTGSYIKWYLTETLGVAITTNPDLINNTTYYASQYENGCESSSRFPVKVFVKKPHPPSGESNQTICNAGYISDIVVTGININWYSTSTNFIPLSRATDLINGNTYYATEKDGDCESINRLAVKVTIVKPNAPTGISPQYFCGSGKISDLKVSGTNTIKWYDTPNIGTGTIYTNTSSLINDKTYYATQIINNCESINRLAIKVNILNVSPPFGEAFQKFCSPSDLRDLDVNGYNIKWYETPMNGISLDYTTPLVDDKIFYASQTVEGCESNNRLAITAVNITPAPIGPTVQYICNYGEIKDLIVSGLSLKWYDAPLNGNTLSPNKSLENNVTYYASQTYGIQGLGFCESSKRLAIKVYLNITPKPTGNSTQTLCNENNFYNLIVNGLGIKWYDSPLDGNLLNPFGIIKDKVKYYASQEINDCESKERLEVLVYLKYTPAPTIGSNNNLPLNPRISDVIIVGTDVKWYDNLNDATNSKNILSTNTLLINGKVYYITQTINGCPSSPQAIKHYNGVLSVNEDIKTNLNFIIIPNPAKDYLTIETNEEIKEFSIFDLNGRLLKSETTNKTNINISDLNKGVYLIKIKSENKISIAKFIKN